MRNGLISCLILGFLLSCSGGGGSSGGQEATAPEPEPEVFAVTSVEPQQAFGDEETLITITGTKFSQGTEVTIGGVACGEIVVESPTTIRCKVPPKAVLEDSSAQDVIVNHPNENPISLARGFTYNGSGQPKNLDISPDVGPNSGGTRITITGTNFVRSTRVEFVGIQNRRLSGGRFELIEKIRNCRNIRVFPRRITCNTPSSYGAKNTDNGPVNRDGIGNEDVRIINPARKGDGARMATLSFRYELPVILDRIEPLVGPQQGENSIKVYPKIMNRVAKFPAQAEIKEITIGGKKCTNPVIGYTSRGFPNHYECIVPRAQSTGTVDVTLATKNGHSTTLEDAYSYVSLPSITSINPNSASSAGSTEITIRGSSFGAGTTVKLGESYCGDGQGNNSPKSVTLDTIVCVTPPKIGGGVVDVEVTNAAFTEDPTIYSNGFTYIVGDAPEILSITPDFGVSTGGGIDRTKVTITGNHFTPNSRVQVEGMDCEELLLIDTQTITCKMPLRENTRSDTDVDVVVMNPDEQSFTLENGYRYIAPPRATNFSPRIGSPEGGTRLRIMGSGFDNGVRVTLSDATCTDLNYIDDSTLECTTPRYSGNPQEAPIGIRIINPDGQGAATSGDFTFDYYYPPQITSITPDQGKTNGMEIITIEGQHLVEPDEVIRKNVAPTSPTSTKIMIGGRECIRAAGKFTTTRIQCITPASSTHGSFEVKVTDLLGQSTTSQFTYTLSPAPTITSIDPNIGSTRGRTEIRITGNNFFNQSQSTDIFESAGTDSIRKVISKKSVVHIGGNPCNVINITPTEITCSLPPSSVGESVDVKITNPDSQSITESGGFTYNFPPSISSISPLLGPLEGGTTVSITGEHFGTGASVTVGGTACSSTVVESSSLIKCVTPSRASEESVQIIVVNPDEQQATATQSFEYSSPPTITSIEPNFSAIDPVNNKTRVRDNYIIKVRGTNFDTESGEALATVTIGGAPCITGKRPKYGTSTDTVISCSPSASPTGEAGTFDVVVTNLNRQSITLEDGFEYGSRIRWEVGTGGNRRPNPDDYGTVSRNVTHTFTLENIGRGRTDTINVTLEGTHPEAWTLGEDACSNEQLREGMSCTVQVIFKAGSLSAGSYSAVLKASETQGSTTNDLLGEKP